MWAGTQRTEDGRLRRAPGSESLNLRRYCSPSPDCILSPLSLDTLHSSFETQPRRRPFFLMSPSGLPRKHGLTLLSLPR